MATLAFSGAGFAQYESHWPDLYEGNYNDFGTFVAAIMIDGEIITAYNHANWNALEVAAFVGENCRGNKGFLYNGYVEEYGDPFPIINGMYIYFTEPGDPVTFKMYDHLAEIEYTDYQILYMGEETTIFTDEDREEGWDDPENPIFLNFITPDQKTTVTFAPEGFATYYNGEKDLVLPTGMKARIVTAAGETDASGNTQLTYETIADGDTETNIVPAATAVLLQVASAEEEQEIDINLVKTEAEPITQKNLLHGSDEAIDTYGEDGDTRFYKLSYSADGGDDFGWYWGSGGGAAFQSGAHKAWLALPAAASSRFLSLPGYDGDTTSVNEELRVKNEESGSAVWYTVDGRRLNGKPTAKGVYIHQGKKAVIE